MDSKNYRVLCRVNLLYNDGQEETFGFLSDKQAEHFMMTSKLREDVTDVKIIKGEH